MTRTARAIALPLAAALGLAGCRSGYDVGVRNLTDQPVEVRLTTPHSDGAPMVLATKRLGPGDRGSMFTQVASGTAVPLEADFQGTVGYPATIDLSPGKTIVNVRRTDSGSQGRLMLEELPRP